MMIAFGVFARVNSPGARPAWKACGQSLWALSARVLLRAGIDHILSTLSAPRRSANMPARRRSDEWGLRGGGPAWPRRGAASALRGRIRNAEIRIHASGFARGASNPKPSLDIPDRNCRTIGTLLGAAKTREAKAVVCREADSLDPKTGEPRTDRKSGAVSVRIDSARSADGVSRVSEFAARLEQFLHRNGVFAAEEVVVLSDGAPWIRTVCAEILPGRKTTFILDLYHALEYAAAALKPHRDRSEDIAACIRYFKANRDRMRYDLYRKRGLPVGSGVVESACKRIVGNRCKKSGCRWSKAGANAVLAVKCCLENMRWPDFLDWRACRAAAA